MNFDFMVLINQHIQESLQKKEAEVAIIEANALNKKLNTFLIGFSVAILLLCFYLETPH